MDTPGTGYCWSQDTGGGEAAAGGMPASRRLAPTRYGVPPRWPRSDHGGVSMVVMYYRMDRVTNMFTQFHALPTWVVYRCRLARRRDANFRRAWLSVYMLQTVLLYLTSGVFKEDASLRTRRPVGWLCLDGLVKYGLRRFKPVPHIVCLTGSE